MGISNNHEAQDIQPIKINDLELLINKITINEGTGGKVIPFKPLSINIDIVADKNVTGFGLQIIISKDSYRWGFIPVKYKTDKRYGFANKKRINKVTCFIENFNLSSGRYVLGFAIDKPNVRWYYYNR